MAIQPIPYAPWPNVPTVDFSPLGNLFNTYQGSKLNEAKLGEAERKQAGLAELGKLNPNDPNYAQQVAAIAVRIGEFGAGASLLNNAAELKLKQEELAAKRSAPTLGGAAPAAPPAAIPAPAQPPAATPPLTGPGPTPPLFARPPSVSTSALPNSDIQPVAQATPPIMAQAGAPGSNFTGFTTASGRPKVSYAGVNQDLLQIANEVGNSLYGTLNRPLGITSARDSTHTTGSQHYVGNALDLRTRDLSQEQRQAIVASFRAKGLTAVDEGDHIHVAMPRGAAPQPGAPGAPGTVLASVQGRGPISTGAGGGAVASASPGVINTPLARTQVAALDPNYTPQTSVTDAGPQLPAGVSPAAPAAQGAAGPPLLPNPTPLSGALPPMNLAALGQQGGVGTIGPMGGVAADAMPPQGVQMAQAAQGGAGPYSPAWPIPQPQGLPVLPQRPAPPQQAPVQRPAVAPQAPPVARGPVSGSPLEHIPNERLMAVATHRYASEGDKQLAIAELNRRATVAAEQNKPSATYNDFLKAREGGFKGDFIEYQQATKSDPSTQRLYEAVLKERAAAGEGPYPGGLAQFAKDIKGGVSVSVGDKADAAQAAQIAKDDAESFKTYIRAGQQARTKVGTLGVLDAMMKTEGFYSGTAATSVTWLKQMRDALGWKENDAPNAGPNEVFRAYSNKVITDELGGLGAGVSNADVQFLSQVAPSLNHSAPGNRMLIAIGRATAARAEKLSEMARAYKKANGGKFDSGFEDIAADYAAKNPIITQEQLEAAARGDIPASRRDLLDKMKRYE